MFKTKNTHVQKSEQLWIYKVNNFFSSFLLVLLGLNVKQSPWMKTCCIWSSRTISGYHLIKREILFKLKIASSFKTRQQNYFQWDYKKKKKSIFSWFIGRGKAHFAFLDAYLYLFPWNASSPGTPHSPLHHCLIMQSHKERTPTFTFFPFFFSWPYTALLNEQQT